MQRKKKLILVALCALLLLGLGLLALRGCSSSRNDPVVLYGNVDIRTVNLSPRVSGRLVALHVDEGDTVEPGQVLGELDQEPYRIAVQQARAEALAQQAQLSLLEAGYRQEEIARVRSDLRDKEVSFSNADTLYKRRQQLWTSRAVSADDLDNARTARNQAEAALQASREMLAQYESGYREQDIETGRARLMQAQAALAKAELDLEDTVIMSPSAGTILTRAVEPGSMLDAGSPVFTLSLTRPVWVRAYVDEVNLAKTPPGAEVRVTVDGRPDRAYTGTIGFVSPTAEFTPKTVQTPELRTDLVFRLRIIIQDPDDSLRQGMPVTIEIPAGQAPADAGKDAGANG